MNLFLPIIASLLLANASHASAMIMFHSNSPTIRLPSSSLYHEERRKLTHESGIESGTTAVVDLCQYNPESGVFNSLPVVVENDGKPDKVFKVENAKGIAFTFSTCDITEEDTAISIWDDFDKNCGDFLAFNDDGGGCGRQSTLSWTAPDDSVYYVKFSAWSLVSYTVDATWSTDKDWEYCFPTAPSYCGPSIIYPYMGTWNEGHDLLCCDNITGAVGPNCCSTIPYDASTSTCCGDGSIVSGADEVSLCSPSSQPTTPPSSNPSWTPSSTPSFRPSNTPTLQPSSFPSSRPSRVTCEMVDPCDYDMENDGMGGVDIIETYHPVCILKNSEYHQECYSENIISGSGAGDVDPCR